MLLHSSNLVKIVGTVNMKSHVASCRNSLLVLVSFHVLLIFTVRKLGTVTLNTILFVIPSLHLKMLYIAFQKFTPFLSCYVHSFPPNILF